MRRVRAATAGQEGAAITSQITAISGIRATPASDIGAEGAVTLRAGLYTVVFPESLLPAASTSCGTLAICV